MYCIKSCIEGIQLCHLAQKVCGGAEVLGLHPGWGRASHVLLIHALVFSTSQHCTLGLFPSQCLTRPRPSLRSGVAIVLTAPAAAHPQPLNPLYFLLDLLQLARL